MRPSQMRMLPAWMTLLPVWCVALAGAPMGTRAEIPSPRQWKDAPGVKVLNNLVAELLRVELPKAGAPTHFTLVNPRDGWIWIGSKTTGDSPVSISLGGATIHVHREAGVLESMRLLPKGSHTLSVSTTAGLESLVVRSIPELVFARFGSGIVLLDTRANKEPRPGEVTRYDREFLGRDILPNVNVLVGSGGPEQEPMRRQWKAQGKRWLVECAAIGISTKGAVTADSIERHVTQSAGFTSPEIDGVLVDEFFDGEHEAFAPWVEAVRRIHASARYRGKLIYPYCTDMYEGQANSRFIQAITDCGWKIALERYLAESLDEKSAADEIDLHLPRTVADADVKVPGCTRHMIACIGTFSQPPLSLDVNPAMNYKVFLDRQINALANDSRCFGLYGVMSYVSSYMEPEMVRWTGRLLRHYCIEGNTAMCSHDPLMLPHLANGDFAQGLSGWQVTEAESGSVAAKTYPGFSWLQGRYPQTKRGDTVLWMKRNAARPNVVCQEIKELEPGRLYTLRMCSGDFRDLSHSQKLGIVLELEGVDVVPGRVRQDVYPSSKSHQYDQFNATRRAWMNYHWMLFRARDRRAMLKISDWSGSSQPGGPAGQELIMNFVQIQPYDE